MSARLSPPPPLSVFASSAPTREPLSPPPTAAPAAAAAATSSPSSSSALLRDGIKCNISVLLHMKQSQVADLEEQVAKLQADLRDSDSNRMSWMERCAQLEQQLVDVSSSHVRELDSARLEARRAAQELEFHVARVSEQFRQETFRDAVMAGPAQQNDSGAAGTTSNSTRASPKKHRGAPSPSPVIVSRESPRRSASPLAAPTSFVPSPLLQSPRLPPSPLPEVVALGQDGAGCFSAPMPVTKMTLAGSRQQQQQQQLLQQSRHISPPSTRNPYDANDGLSFTAASLRQLEEENRMMSKMLMQFDMSVERQQQQQQVDKSEVETKDSTCQTSGERDGWGDPLFSTATRSFGQQMGPGYFFTTATYDACAQTELQPRKEAGLQTDAPRQFSRAVQANRTADTATDAELSRIRGIMSSLKEHDEYRERRRRGASATTMIQTSQPPQQQPMQQPERAQEESCSSSSRSQQQLNEMPSQLQALIEMHASEQLQRQQSLGNFDEQHHSRAPMQVPGSFWNRALNFDLTEPPAAAVPNDLSFITASSSAGRNQNFVVLSPRATQNQQRQSLGSEYEQNNNSSSSSSSTKQVQAEVIELRATVAILLSDLRDSRRQNFEMRERLRQMDDAANVKL